MDKYIKYGEKNRAETKMEKYIKLAIILFGVWFGVFIVGPAIVFFHIGEEGFHPEAVIKEGVLIGLYVDAVVFNLWLFRRMIEKFTFFDNINRNCRKCKNLMCVRRNKEIEYKCAIRHHIMNSDNCRKSTAFKRREKIVPVDRANYIRKYAIIASIASGVLGVLLAISIPQGFSTGAEGLVFAELSILCGIFALFAVSAMVVLWLKWWEWSDHKDKNKEEIIIFNELDDEQGEDNQGNDIGSTDEFDSAKYQKELDDFVKQSNGKKVSNDTEKQAGYVAKGLHQLSDFLNKDVFMYDLLKDVELIVGGSESKYNARLNTIFISNDDNRDGESFSKALLNGTQLAVSALTAGKIKMEVEFPDTNPDSNNEDVEENLPEPKTDDKKSDDENKTLQELLDELEKVGVDAFDEVVDEHQDETDETDEALSKIGRPVIDVAAAMKHGIMQPLPGQNLPKLSPSHQIPKPNESTEAFCQRLHLHLMQGDGFGYMVDDPIGYCAVLGITREDEYFMSIIPDHGENWKLMAFYRIGSFQDCVDKYVVMYSGQVNGKNVGYAYELYLWMYDQNGFPNNLTGIYRVPQGFKPNPNKYTWANKTLYNRKHNLYGGSENGVQGPVKEITKREVADALKRLEEKYHSRDGYNVAQILLEIGVNVNKENMVKVRGLLRNMMSRKMYPEIKTAGISDIVYPPLGKNTGKYRLSKYRGL